MKATTTVTTTSYYGNVQSSTNNESKAVQFITPQQMIRRLIPYANVQKENIRPQQEQMPSVQKASLVKDIEKLQSELNNIHAEVVESENLLNVRDSLYGQLDMLREEREQIQNDVAVLENQYSSSKEIKVSIKPNQGYREMNDRLRRRMSEIREYIHKMEIQNRKIEENLNYTNMLNMEKNYRTQIPNPYIETGYLNQRQRNINRVDDLITRLHVKQEQALQKVRRQQEEIQRRNQMNRASFANRSLSPQYKTFTGSIQDRRKFYSPQYRY